MRHVCVCVFVVYIKKSNIRHEVIDGRAYKNKHALMYRWSEFEGGSGGGVRWWRVKKIAASNKHEVPN